MEVPVDIRQPAVIKKMEKGAGKEIKKELQIAIKQAQTNKVDIFGFGEALARMRPNQWEKLKSEWDDVYFPKLDVDVKVEAYIRRTGLRNKSFLSSVKEKQN